MKLNISEYEERILGEVEAEGRSTKALRDFLFFKTIYEETKQKERKVRK